MTITPRRGAVVTQLSRQEFIDAYQVREALETLAVRLAVPLMSDAEIAHLRELCELMARAARDDEVRLFFDTNNSFHEALVRGSRNQKLHEVHRVLVGQMAPYLPRSLELRGNLQQSVAEHEAILAAVDARDAERAAELLAEHIEVPAARARVRRRPGAVPRGPDACRRYRSVGGGTDDASERGWARGSVRGEPEQPRAADRPGLRPPGAARPVRGRGGARLRLGVGRATRSSPSRATSR